MQLLNGQLAELNCRSDALVSDIFGELCIVILDFTADSFCQIRSFHISTSPSTTSSVLLFSKVNILFCLLMTSNDAENEYYFLESHSRLEKFAPSNWKRATPADFTLHLRFKFYPKRVEFIRLVLRTYTREHQTILQNTARHA